MDFRAFEATPGVSVIVFPNAPTYTLAAVTNDFVKTSGMKRQDVIGKGHFEVFPKSPADINFTGEKNIIASFEYVLKNKEPYEIPLQRYDIPNGDGTFRQKYWKINNAPILNDAGEVEFIIHSALDVTERIVAQQKVESSRVMEKAYNFFMSAPVVIGFVRGEDYIIEMANEGLLEVWKRSAEVVGMPLVKVIPELEQQGFIALLDQVCLTGEPFYANEYPITLIRDGKEEVLYFDFIYKPYYEDEKTDRAAGVFSVGHDVTEKVLSRKKLKESEEKYRTLFNTMDQGFCVIDLVFDENNRAIDYIFRETNPLFKEQTGLSNAIGKRVRQLVPDLEPHWFERYGNVALTGQSIHFVESSDAMGRWFDVNAFPIEYEGSRKVALLFTDITERKKTEEALQLSESNLRNMILQSPIAMGILRGDTFVVEIANDKMFELWGRSKEELLGKSIFEGLPEAKDQGYEELLTSVYTTGNTFSAFGTAINLPRNGGLEKIYVNLLYEPFREADGTISGIMVAATDVTDQVQARIKMEESNKELLFAMDVMPQMVWVTLPNGFHEFYNKQWYDYTGLSPDQSKNTGWNTVLHDDDKERSWKIWRNSLETGSAYEIEYRFKRYDGVYRWFLGRALPLKDEAGNILKWFGTCTDIDDQKKATQLMEETVKERTEELNVTIQELERSNANLEDFAYAASHDLKEPIRKIKTFGDRIKMQLKDRILPDEMNYFDRVDKATERMQNLIDDLLAYSHVATNVNLLEKIDLNKKVQQVLEDLELEIADKNANVVVNELPVIKGHATQIEQLFQNLISNALKFSKPDVTPNIVISSSIVTGEENRMLHATAISDGKRFNLIEISDNGIGFEQKYADKIFKMFQRLHGRAEYEGTGIGLAIVRKVVDNHNGFIEAESKPGHGSTFKVLLPIVEE